MAQPFWLSRPQIGANADPTAATAGPLHGLRLPRLRETADIKGLSPNPPRHAAAFCVDEKSDVPARNRRDRVSPTVGVGEARRTQTNGSLRHGTLPPFLDGIRTSRLHFRPAYSSGLNRVELPLEGSERRVFAGASSRPKGNPGPEAVAAHQGGRRARQGFPRRVRQRRATEPCGEPIQGRTHSRDSPPSVWTLAVSREKQLSDGASRVWR